MQKSRLLSLLFIIASVALISWTVFVVAAENRDFISKGTIWTSSSPSLAGVSKTNGYYIISLAFSSVNYSRQLQNTLINPNNQEVVAGLTGDINGTSVNGTNPVFAYCLKSGDNLQVKAQFPCSAFVSGTTIWVEVMGDCFGTRVEILLP
jgi:hypothetical protein